MTMLATACKLALTRWVDSEGRVHLDQLPPEIARLLAAPEPKLKERLLRHPEAIERVTDPDSAEDRPFRFRHFLGESAIWPGPAGLVVPLALDDGRIAWECRFCHGLRLSIDDYCLGCDRCGRELEIPSVSEAERPPQTSYRPSGTLRGGVG
jgi:hypothetical protein